MCKKYASGAILHGPEACRSAPPISEPAPISSASPLHPPRASGPRRASCRHAPMARAVQCGAASWRGAAGLFPSTHCARGTSLGQRSGPHGQPQHPYCVSPTTRLWRSIGRSIETERARGVLEASRGLVSGRDGAGLINYIDSSGTELIGLRGDLCWLRRHSGRRRLEPPTAVRMRHSGRAPQLPEGRCVSRTERFERARASYVPDEPPPATRGSRCVPGGTVFASLRGPPVDMMQDELRKPTTRAE